MIYTLAALHFCAHADRALPAALAPVLRQRFDLSDAELGLMHGTAFILPFAAAALVLGARGGRFDARRMLIVSVTAWTLAGLLFAVAASLEELLLARVALGLGQAGFAPAAVALLSRRDRSAMAIGTFTAGSAAGRSGGLLIAGVLLTLAGIGPLAGMEPWRMAGLWLLAPNLVLLALLIVAGRADTPAAGPLSSGGIAAWRRLAMRPWPFLTHLLAASAAVLIVQAGGAWASSIVHRGFAIGPGAAATLTGATILLTAPAGHLLAGRIAARRVVVAPGPLMIAGTAAALVACMMLAIAPVLPVALLAIGLLSAGGGFAAAAALIGLQPMVRAGDRLPVNAGYFAIVSLVGFGLGPLATGFASDRLGGAGDSLAVALAALAAVATLIVAAAALAGAKGWRHVVREAGERAAGAA